MITSEQIRAARALLRLGQGELARRARTSTATIRRLEAAGGTHRVGEDTVSAVRSELEKAGAEFIADGVRRRPLKPDQEVKRRRLLAIAEQSAAMLTGRPIFSDEDLYDENGLPK
ncbi:MAG: XRE family transcriptional regulator [Thalassobaculum sp.]|uniref:helix-turn-helix domain-containing protein n=1 Tax=Thalassobaculum sp. TaxID=2022740 RepID=UPI0032EF0670